MTEQKIMLEALKKASLGTDKGTASFVAWLEKTPHPDWDELMRKLRSQYDPSKAALVQAIWSSGDPVLRTRMLRNLDPQRADEEALLNKLVSATTGASNTPLLRAALESGNRALLERIARKRSLPVEFRREVDALLLVPPEA